MGIATCVGKHGSISTSRIYKIIVTVRKLQKVNPIILLVGDETTKILLQCLICTNFSLTISLKMIIEDNLQEIWRSLGKCIQVLEMNYIP